MLIGALGAVALGFVFLVVSLVTETPAWAWGCLAMCVLAVGALLVDSRRRRVGVLSGPGAAAAPADAPATEDRTAVLPVAAGPAPAAPAPAAPASVAPPAVVPPEGVVEPDEEDPDAADALVLGALSEEVLVVDEHPRFHLGSCPWLVGRTTTALSATEAVELGFSPCALCRPSQVLAAQSRVGTSR